MLMNFLFSFSQKLHREQKNVMLFIEKYNVGI